MKFADTHTEAAFVPSANLAPDLIGAVRTSHDSYPVAVVVNDHELGRITLRCTRLVATELRDELTAALR